MNNDYKAYIRNLEHCHFGQDLDSYDKRDTNNRLSNSWWFVFGWFDSPKWGDNIDNIRKPAPTAKPVKMKRIIPHTIIIDVDGGMSYYICDRCYYPMKSENFYCPHCGQNLFEEVDDD